MRALSFVVRGPTSMLDYRTYKDDVYATYWEAAVAQGLCDDDQCVWRNAAEAAMQTLKHLRERVHWMSVFLINTQPNNPVQIVEENLQWLAPRHITDPKTRMDYFLRRLEYMLRFISNFIYSIQLITLSFKT